MFGMFFAVRWLICTCKREGLNVSSSSMRAPSLTFGVFCGCFSTVSARCFCLGCLLRPQGFPTADATPLRRPAFSLVATEARPVSCHFARPTDLATGAFLEPSSNASHVEEFGIPPRMETNMGQLSAYSPCLFSLSPLLLHSSLCSSSVSSCQPTLQDTGQLVRNRPRARNDLSMTRNRETATYPEA